MEGGLGPGLGPGVGPGLGPGLGPGPDWGLEGDLWCPLWVVDDRFGGGRSRPPWCCGETTRTGDLGRPVAPCDGVGADPGPKGGGSSAALTRCMTASSSGTCFGESGNLARAEGRGVAWTDLLVIPPALSLSLSRSLLLFHLTVVPGHGLLWSLVGSLFSTPHPAAPFECQFEDVIKFLVRSMCSILFAGLL